jgi:CheY-like chemotaxis protein
VKILIADNNKNLSFVLKQELEVEGYSVDSVSNGIDAVNRVIDSNDYQFLLIDLLLPGLDGLNTLKLIKKIRPKMNIIAVSESMPYDGRKECLDAGANMYFPKHCEIEKIKNYISEQGEDKEKTGSMGQIVIGVTTEGEST